MTTKSKSITEAKAGMLPPRLIICEAGPDGQEECGSETQSSTDDEKERTIDDPRAATKRGVDADESRTSEDAGRDLDLAAAAAGLALGRDERPSHDEDDDAASVDSATTVETCAHLSPLHVGRIIGRGGEVVRDVQSRSGARIDVDQHVPEGAPRIITYRGTRAEVEFAKRLVALLCDDAEAGGKDRSGELPLGRAVRKEVFVPGSSIGRIIGRGGATVRELQIRSEARIQVDHSNEPSQDERNHARASNDGTGTEADLRRITITGSKQSVAMAEEMLLCLAQNPGMDGRSIARSRHVNPESARRSEPRTSLLTQQHHGVDVASVGGTHMEGAPYFWGGGFEDHSTAAAYGYVQQSSWDGSWDGPRYAQGAATDVGTVEMDIIPCARRDIGHVIGRKGATVKNLQRVTSCDIQIDQRLCTISISGPRVGIEEAKRMIQEIIERGSGSQYHYQQQQQQQQLPLNYAHHDLQQRPYRAPQPPSPWREAATPEGRVYYYNPDTMEARWDCPMGML